MQWMLSDSYKKEKKRKEKKNLLGAKWSSPTPPPPPKKKKKIGNIANFTQSPLTTAFHFTPGQTPWRHCVSRKLEINPQTKPYNAKSVENLSALSMAVNG